MGGCRDRIGSGRTGIRGGFHRGSDSAVCSTSGWLSAAEHTPKMKPGLARTRQPRSRQAHSHTGRGVYQSVRPTSDSRKTTPIHQPSVFGFPPRHPSPSATPCASDGTPRQTSTRRHEGLSTPDIASRLLRQTARPSAPPRLRTPETLGTQHALATPSHDRPYVALLLYVWVVWRGLRRLHPVCS